MMTKIYDRGGGLLFWGLLLAVARGQTHWSDPLFPRGLKLFVRKN